MKKPINILFISAVFVFVGCYEPKDTRIHLREEIRSDTLDSSIVTRPVSHAFSALIGEGIGISRAVTRRNNAGFLELHIEGFNKSYETKRFRYRVEWLDADGLLLETKTSVWMPMSAMGKSPFSFKVVAPRTEAVNFRMDTRKWE
ncbi:MAG: YcfL family protein [Sedimentisphaerales bacterium]|nr:YcfL family protein [Sedimentisphaerales bacterium]